MITCFTRLWILLPFLLSVTNSFGQPDEACLPPTAKDKLDINHIRTTYHPSAQLWFDQTSPGFEIISPTPGEPPLSLLVAGGLWIAGINPQNNLYTAAHTYHADNSDYWAGPLDLATGTTDYPVCLHFNRLWKVLAAEVASHISDFNDNGVIDGPVPAAVLAWPGRNNPNSFLGNGFELPLDQPLAPFVDRNGNGDYEPMLGDFPKIKGDQALWWVFNDEGGGALHKETNGLALRVEVQALAYAFEGANDDNLSNTTFLEFKIINRRTEKLDSIFASLWTDFDLTYFLDDNFGCIPSDKIAYLYSAEGVQNPDCFNTPQDDCIATPIITVKQLIGPKGESGADVGFSSFITFNNPTWGNPLPSVGTTDPSVDFEYYNYMQGKWKNGQALTYGGDGFNPANPPTNFMFPGNPADSADWSMCSTSLPIYDRRMMINSGPFSLAPGESTTVSYAIFPVFTDDYPCPDITPIVDIGNEIQEVFDGLTAVTNTLGNKETLRFYPNPMHSEGRLVLSDTRHTIQEAILLGADGRVVKNYRHLHTHELVIQRDNLPAGLYFYKILTSDGQWSTGRAVMD
ncbi:MAG: T9SS type A sorting domain-containing protein [Lewinellaceae bacterium]|nr:T9SS type A sorting domain-containing protein [Lewinellaceae bacterium]